MDLIKRMFDNLRFSVRVFDTMLRFLRQKSGEILIEFAVVFPIMITVVSGIFETTMFYIAHNTLTRTAGVLADNIARQSDALTKAQITANIQAYFSTTPKMIEPFNVAPCQMVVSLVYNNGQTTNPSNMRISWQETYQSGVSKLGGPGSVPSNMPDDLQVTRDMEVLVMELSYNYNPLIFEDFFGTIPIYETFVYVPRTGSLVKS